VRIDSSCWLVILEIRVSQSSRNKRAEVPQNSINSSFIKTRVLSKLASDIGLVKKIYFFRNSSLMTKLDLHAVIRIGFLSVTFGIHL
jgi:hypothetical protein